MPPTARFSREDVLHAAYALVRREGPGALHARALAREMHCSTQPIFRLFSGMDELMTEVKRLADETLCGRMRSQTDDSCNRYVSVCLTYMLFARDEPELFKLLFMRDRMTDGSFGREYNIAWGFPVIERTMDVSREDAIKLYEHSFFYVHGLAVCIATKYTPCMEEARMEALITESLLAAAKQLNITLKNI